MDPPPTSPSGRKPHVGSYIFEFDVDESDVDEMEEVKATARSVHPAPIMAGLSLTSCMNLMVSTVVAVR